MQKSGQFNGGKARCGFCARSRFRGHAPIDEAAHSDWLREWAVSSLKCNASGDDRAKLFDWEVALRSQQA
jgi:hypothetical protein